MCAVSESGLYSDPNGACVARRISGVRSNKIVFPRVWTYAILPLTYVCQQHA